MALKAKPVVLLIDPDSGCGDALSRALQGLDINTHTAGSAEAGRSLLKSYPLDVLVVNLRPGFEAEGMALAQEVDRSVGLILCKPRNKHIPHVYEDGRPVSMEYPLTPHKIASAILQITAKARIQREQQAKPA